MTGVQTCALPISKFAKEWRAIVGPYTAQNVNFAETAPPDKGFTYGYGAYVYPQERGAGYSTEDKATQGDVILRTNYFKPLLSKTNPYHRIYRAKLAMMVKYKFISAYHVQKLFASQGLKTDSASLQKYIDESARWAAQQGRRK